jgi:hypothetical protein
MSCDVRVYDINASPLPWATLEFTAIETDPAHLANLSQPVSNTAISNTKFGASLNFHAKKCIYLVAIMDLANTYGPLTISSLNGNEPGQLDVIVKKVPPQRRGGIAVSSSSQLVSFMNGQGWSREQQGAILDVITALTSMRGGRTSPSPNVHVFIARCEELLLTRSIDPRAF